jgi:hypothetical protein
MGNLNDYFWVEEDRARIVRMIQANVPEKVFTIDCTFEVARLADDNTNAAVVVCNEKQLVCFFAFVDKESSEAYKLLLALSKHVTAVVAWMCPILYSLTTVVAMTATF